MKIVFASNYFNHHQQPFSEALVSCGEVDYHFIAFGVISNERKALGYHNGDMPDYVHEDNGSQEARRVSLRLLDEADAVIFGSAPEWVVENARRQNKLIFRYSERPLKNGPEPRKYLPRWFRWHFRNPKHAKIYLLCASAYTAPDYRKFGLFKNRAYKWGYFPKTKRYEDLSALMAQKDPSRLLWCGRFLEWKYPDDAVTAAKRLKEEGFRFELRFIGIGPMKARLQTLVSEYGLSDCVRFLGSMPPEQVWQEMEAAGIYLFTSGRQEGWGAVLNESMNRGCAVVACDAAGSTPYMIKSGENGLSYHEGDTAALYNHMKYLLEHPAEQVRLGAQAYRTITELWNAELAAQRLVRLCRSLMLGEPPLKEFDDGPCSSAETVGYTR